MAVESSWAEGVDYQGSNALPRNSLVAVFRNEKIARQYHLFLLKTTLIS